jgi:hypothetical protein
MSWLWEECGAAAQKQAESIIAEGNCTALVFLAIDDTCCRTSYLSSEEVEQEWSCWANTCCSSSQYCSAIAADQQLRGNLYDHKKKQKHSSLRENWHNSSSSFLYDQVSRDSAEPWSSFFLCDLVVVLSRDSRRSLTWESRTTCCSFNTILELLWGLRKW